MDLTLAQVTWVAKIWQEILGPQCRWLEWIIGQVTPAAED